MNRKDCVTGLGAAALVIAVAATAPAYTQQEAGNLPTTLPTPENAVERILAEQDTMQSAQRFSYDPAGRRDPFRSLLERVKLTKGPRPKGVGGMLVTELDLVGVVRDDHDGNVAFFMGPDNKGYFLAVGDDVYDGTLIAMDPDAGSVSFRQQVDDPRLIKPYRDVVKRLIPLDEETGNE